MPAAAQKLVQNLNDAGFGVGTVHAKMSGPPEARGKRLYKVQHHVEGGFLLEYCKEGPHTKTNPGGTGWAAYGATKESCTTTGVPGNYYNQGRKDPVTYSLAKAQKKENEAKCHTLCNERACAGVAFTNNQCWIISHDETGTTACTKGGKRMFNMPNACWKEQDLGACNKICQEDDTCVGSEFYQPTGHPRALCHLWRKK